MNKNQVTGHVEETKGRVKKVVGKILDDKKMEVKGRNIQKSIGKARAGFGDVKEDVKKSVS